MQLSSRTVSVRKRLAAWCGLVRKRLAAWCGLVRKRLAAWCGLVLCLAAGSLGVAPSAGAVAGYGDVGGDSYYVKPVQWSVDNGITGINDACFSPDAPVSRGESAVYLWNMEGQPSAELHSFTDVTFEFQNGGRTLPVVATDRP